MRIILMGTGPFAVPAFDAIRAKGYNIVCVVTRPAQQVKSRKGPPPQPVRTWAESQGLEVTAPPSINSTEAIESLAKLSPDLLVVCDYGQILSDAALSTAKLGGINLHGSLLPKYRGAAPVQRALLAGDPLTGVSVIHMTPKLDGGPILATAELSIAPEETSGELEERLSDLGVEPTLSAISKLEDWDGTRVLGCDQDPQAVTRAPRLSKKEALIDWTRSNVQLDCFIRGMLPWPIAYTFLPTGDPKPPLRVAIKKARVIQSDSIEKETYPVQLSGADGNITPGSLLRTDRMLIQTGEGVLELLQVQPAGKREMTGEEFMRGYQPALGTVMK
ncbi:MAG: methionyl-tRNA formyltransferase [Rubripirellula sp.]